jgi:hypothetical protein
MAQPIRNTQARPPAYWETLRERVAAGKAVEVLNSVLETDEKVSAQKVAVAMFYVNKLLPSMQAIAVQVEHKVSASMPDLTARALAAGLDPEALFYSKPLTQEKSDSPAD